MMIVALEWVLLAVAGVVAGVLGFILWGLLTGHPS